MTKPPATPVDHLTRDQLAMHVEQARLHVRAIRRLLPGLTQLTDEERKCNDPIIDDEHADALAAVLEAVALVPDHFKHYCDPFVWPEPDQFTVEVGRELLAIWRTLQPLVTELSSAASELSDHLAVIGEQLRAPLDGRVERTNEPLGRALRRPSRRPDGIGCSCASTRRAGDEVA